MRPTLRFIQALVVSMGISLTPVGACTPTKVQQAVYVGGMWVETWCCCDAKWQQCSWYEVVPGAEQGNFIGPVDAAAFCPEAR